MARPDSGLSTPKQVEYYRERAKHYTTVSLRREVIPQLDELASLVGQEVGIILNSGQAIQYAVKETLARLRASPRPPLGKGDESGVKT